MKLFKLLIASAVMLLVICVSSTVYAAKPPSHQILTSPPMFGTSFVCAYRNVSDGTLKYAVTLFSSTGKVLYEKTSELGPGSANSSSTPSADDVVSCEITWVGQGDEMRASFCVYDGLGLAAPVGCVEMF